MKSVKREVKLRVETRSNYVNSNLTQSHLYSAQLVSFGEFCFFVGMRQDLCYFDICSFATVVVSLGVCSCIELSSN